LSTVPGALARSRSFSLASSDHQSDLTARGMSGVVFTDFGNWSPAEFFEMLGQFTSNADPASRI
jgi:hypothetical protein